jgi:hypothetical protein
MEAPKMKGMFRNVRSKPRVFTFKSRHTSENRKDWEERKKKIEADVMGDSQDSAPSRISFRKRHTSNRKASRQAMLRTLAIVAVLMYITYQLIVWAETTEWDKMLEFIRDNG